MKKGYGYDHSCHSVWTFSTCRHYTWLAQLQISQVTLRVFPVVSPGPMARHCFHEPQTQEPGCAHWYLPTPATTSLGPAQSSLQGPGSRHWAHKISQWPAMAKTRNAATVLGCKSRQEERCSPRTETDSHPIKLVVFDMSDLAASWEEASVRSLLGRAVRAHAGNSTHRKALSQRKWGLCNGSSATFYNKVKGSCTGENSLREKKSSGQL